MAWRVLEVVGQPEDASARNRRSLRLFPPPFYLHKFPKSDTIGGKIHNLLNQLNPIVPPPPPTVPVGIVSHPPLLSLLVQMPLLTQPSADAKKPVVEAGGGGGELSLSCDTAESATSRTLLDWKVVPPADAADGGEDGGGSRLELTMDEETLGMLSQIDTKVCLGRHRPIIQQHSLVYLIV